MPIPHYPIPDFFYLPNPYSLPTTDSHRFFNSLYESNYNSLTGEPYHFRVMDPNKFQLRIDVNLSNGFKAKDVSVTIVNGFIVVNAKQDERPGEHDFISKSFTGRYRLPDDVETNNITYSLGGFDDVITVKAPRKVQVSSACKKGRIIPLVIGQSQMGQHSFPTDISQMNRHFYNPLQRSFQSYEALLARARLELEHYREEDSNKFILPINYKMFEHFKAEEIDVRLTDDFVVVSAKHDERRGEHNFISYEFTRRYKLPDDVVSDEISASWRKDGIVIIKAPKMGEVPTPFEGSRFVPIGIERSPRSDSWENILDALRI